MSFFCPGGQGGQTMTNEIPDIPLAMRKVYRRLKRWRSSHARRLPIPEPLWAAAAELAREHGIFPTAKALHLEYGKLKQEDFLQTLKAPARHFLTRCAPPSGPAF